MSDRPKLILIDGHSLAYRAYFAMANTPLSIKRDDGSDEPTGAVFAFTNMLLKVMKQEQPDRIAVAFDVGRTFRDDLYADYKGTREKMPDELQQQMKRIQQVVHTFGIPIFTADGFEADDVLGTLAKRASHEGMDVLIVTGDRDALQLVSPAVKIFTSRKSFDDTIIYDEALVVQNYGVEPKQLIDYKALLGDTSDNVPGVRGIGEKTAQSLLQQYKTLDSVYAHLSEVTPKRAQSALEAGKDSAYLSKTLVTIRTDVPLTIDWDACAAELDYAHAAALFRELKFESLIKRLPQLNTEAGAKVDAAQNELMSAPVDVPRAPFTQATYKLVDSDAQYKALLKALNGARQIAFDTETTGTDPQTAELVGMSFSVKDGEAWYLPIAARSIASETEGQSSLFGSATASVKPAHWELDSASAKFEPIVQAMQQPKTELIAHNSKYDMAVLHKLGVSFDKPVYDTMLAQFVCEPSSPLGLKALAAQLLDMHMTEISELIGTGKKQISMREVPIEKVAPYAAADADATYRLAQLLKPRVKQLQVEKLLNTVEIPLVPVLIDMEATGVALDVKYLGLLSVEITERLRELEKQIYEQAGLAFNVNSTQQLSDVLFGKLQLPTQGVSKTAARGKEGKQSFSTAADVLESLRGKHAIIPLILEHRELSKLKGTYVDALPELINPNTHRIHTDFNQAGAITGRMSSSNPNLQNIPIKTELGRRVRKAFVARKGWRIISADYSQVELRILAHLADDEKLKDAFARNEDIHATTAAAIYDLPLKEVNAVQRNFAKRINFGIAYGMGAFALSQNTGMSMGEAQDFIKRYFERFPKVQAWLAHTKQLAADQGYVETVLGRRRYFPELQSKAANDQMKRRAEREAINHPVQGSAADIMKLAMIHIHKALNDGGYQARMTLQVHDELVFECPTPELDAVSELIDREMEGAYPLSVRLKADVAVGTNWDEVE